ncbi:MAG: hypothetical protein K6D97_04870 [Clostridia bacterium]|nr:hypothetical protein [Clostridia bacterium]
MLISKPKVFVYFNCGRRIEYPYGVDLNSIDDFITMMESQYEFEKSLPDFSKDNLKTIRCYPDVIDLAKKTRGNFLRFRRDVSTSTVIVEFEFQKVNDTINFKHQVDEFKGISGKYAYTFSFEGNCHLSIFHWMLANPLGLCTTFEQAADECRSNEDQSTLYFNLSRFFTCVLDIPYYKVKTIKNRGLNVDVDLLFMNISDSNKSLKRLASVFN